MHVDKIVVRVVFDNGDNSEMTLRVDRGQNLAAMHLESTDQLVWIRLGTHEQFMSAIRAATREENAMTEKRTYDKDREPVSLDGAEGRDPSNTDIEDLLAPLEADDDVYQLVNPDQGDLRETAPVGEHLGKRPAE